MTFFQHDRRRCIDTRFGEAILCLVALGYGWHALHAPKPSQITSQFQVLLLLEGTVFGFPVSWLTGIIMCVAGIAGALFAYSRFHFARFVAHAMLVASWVGIAMLFLSYKEPGIPLFNGMVFGIASAIVCITILTHEKHASDHHSCC